MTTVTVSPGLDMLSDEQLCQAWSDGAVDLPTLEAECTRRDRSDRARAASRRRHSDWEAAAYAQYEAAEKRCRGNMLSAAGKRAGRDPWPMLWHGSDETARALASDELITFWDYESPRVPGPGTYASAKRSAELAAERNARDTADAGRIAAEQAARAPGTATRPPGSIARCITALGHLQRQADSTARSLARVNGGASHGI